MKLKKYLELNNERAYIFAQRAGLGYELVYKVLQDKELDIKKSSVLKIMSATDGAVRFEDLI